MRSVNGALEKITGRDFGYNPRSSTQQKDVEKWVEWWKESWKNFPRQVGEPELDEKAEDYQQKLLEAKELSLGKVKFPPPEDFIGVQKGVTPGKRP